MNSFFTLLLAASCLTAVGQVDSLIGTGFLSMEQSPTTLSIVGCSVGHPYILKVEGLWSVWGGSCERGDGAFVGGDPDGFDSPPPYTPGSEWIWNDPGGPYQNNRPSPDEYNVDHVYWFPFVAESETQTFSFVDPSPSDNCGGLTFSIYAAQGCTDPAACNYSMYFIESSDDCDYSCCPGPGCCHEGTVWDLDLQQCIVANPADINLDGCVRLGDLLDFLAAYGDCAAEESAWQCGDSLEYQGYDYETVQIGEQCWFAENLRAENYSNGDVLSANLDNDNWKTATSGAVAVYVVGDSSYLEIYGRHYNWFAVADPRGLCPNDWYVPLDSDWTELAEHLGGLSVAGCPMKTTIGWSEDGNGSNSSSFSGLPGGTRYGTTGGFNNGGTVGLWWSLTPSSPHPWSFYLSSSNCELIRTNSEYNQQWGHSVRCIKGAE